MYTKKELLPEKLQSCECIVKQQQNPKAKIVGIANHTDMSEKDIEEDINSRNFKHFSTGGKILYKYNSKRNKTSTLLMAVTPEIYKYLRENKSLIWTSVTQSL